MANMRRVVTRTLQGASLVAGGIGLYKGVKADKTASGGKKFGKAVVLGGGYEGYELSKKRKRPGGVVPSRFAQGLGAATMGQMYTAYQKVRSRGGGAAKGLAAGALAPVSNLYMYGQEALNKHRSKRK